MPVIQGRRALALLLDDLLSQQKYVLEARSNPITGRLLIVYDRSLSSANFRERLRALLEDFVSVMPDAFNNLLTTPVRDQRNGADSSLPLVRRNVVVLGLMAGGTILAVTSLSGWGLLAGCVLIIAGHGLAKLTEEAPAGSAALARLSPAHRVWLAAGKNRKGFIIGAFFTVLSVAFSLSRLVIIGSAVDLVVNSKTTLLSPLRKIGLRPNFLTLGLFGLASTLLQAAFEYAGRIAWRDAAQRTQNELRMELYKHVQTLDISYFEQESTGRLLGVLTQNVEQVSVLFDSIFDVLRISANAVIVGLFFLAFASEVALFAMVPIPLILLGANLLERRLMPRLRRAGDQSGVLKARIAADLEGITTIRSFSAESREIAAIQKLSERLQARNQDAERIASLASPILEMLIMGGTLLTLTSARRLVERNQLSPGGYASLIMLTGQLLWPIAAMGQAFERYQKTSAAVGTVFQTLDIKTDFVSGDRALPSAKVRGDIVFSDVSFQYAAGRVVFQRLYLAIPAGSTVAIVGATGCGKSTLVKLLLRFHQPQSGSISLDGIPIQEISVEDLRSAIGLVSQDVFLFDGSLLDNVRFGDPTASIERVEAACRIAKILDFIRELPDRFNTRIGERGVKLSWGQRQRLSIARTVLRRSPILILDEGTSALDHETEAAIYRSLSSEFPGVTLVIIAHRLSTIRNVDHIFYLEHGKVVEHGTHNDLLQANGRYATALSFAGVGLMDDTGNEPG